MGKRKTEGVNAQARSRIWDFLTQKIYNVKTLGHSTFDNTLRLMQMVTFCPSYTSRTQYSAMKVG